jgi:hypothetical protein
MLRLPSLLDRPPVAFRPARSRAFANLLCLSVRGFLLLGTTEQMAE